MDSTFYLGLFLDEGRERLQQLEEMLAALVLDPTDGELLDDVFRTVHTFKGMADTMGFSDLAELTHRMESVFDAVRQEAIAFDPQLGRLFSRCLVALVQRVEALRDGRTSRLPDGLAKELSAVLVKIKRVPQPAGSFAEMAWGVPAGEPSAQSQSQIYRIEIILDAGCYMKSARALMIIATLELLGAVLDITPSLEELEWSDSTDRFSVSLATDTAAVRIYEAFAGIGEIASVSVAPCPAAANGTTVENPNLTLSSAMRTRLTAALAGGLLAWRISVSLMPHSRMKAARAYLALNALMPYGEALVLDPEPATMEEGDDAFHILFLSGEDPSLLEQALLAIGEVVAVTIAPFVDDLPVHPVGLDLGTILDAQNLAQVARTFVPASLGPRRHRMVRVSAAQLDTLMELAGQLTAGHVALGRLAAERGIDPSDPLSEILEQVSLLGAHLGHDLIKLRMVPIETVFNRFPRMIRDLAHDLGKQVQLIVTGAELELDRLLLDELGDLLLHLLRNALDHGLETPAERQSLGKDALGTLRLSAHLDGSEVLITVADDGRGIDVARVLAIAIAQGRLSPHSASELSASQALDLIFLPGISTALETTRLSGRGVGLDAVRARVLALGGTLAIETGPGRGCIFHLRFRRIAEVGPSPEEQPSKGDKNPHPISPQGIGAS